ncbi:MAG: hypothetical protein ABIO55_00725 [Ginsengibacter sp.]
MKNLFYYTAVILLIQLLPGTSTTCEAQVSFKKHTISNKFISEGAATGDVNHDGKTDILAFIQRLQSYVNETASFLIVEYDTNQSNPWVPYPLNVEGWQKLFKEAGYSQFEEIDRHSSSYGRAEIVGMYFCR